MQGRALGNRSNELVDLDASAYSAELHVSLVRCAVRSHHDRQPGHALPPDEADLDLPVAGPIRHDRGKAAIGKIDMFDPTIAQFEWTAKGEIDGFQMGHKQAEVSSRETNENTIGS